MTKRSKNAKMDMPELPPLPYTKGQFIAIGNGDGDWRIRKFIRDVKGHPIVDIKNLEESLFTEHRSLIDFMIADFSDKQCEFYD